jgi:hypothetical protein
MVKKKTTIKVKSRAAIVRKNKKDKGILRKQNKNTLFQHKLSETQNYSKYQLLKDPNMKKVDVQRELKYIDSKEITVLPPIPEEKERDLKHHVTKKEGLILSELVKKHGDNYTVN